MGLTIRRLPETGKKPGKDNGPGGPPGGPMVHAADPRGGFVYAKMDGAPDLGDEVPQQLRVAETPAALQLIQPLLRTVLSIVDARFVARQSEHLLLIRERGRRVDGRLDLLLLE